MAIKIDQTDWGKVTEKNALKIKCIKRGRDRQVCDVIKYILAKL